MSWPAASSSARPGRGAPIRDEAREEQILARLITEGRGRGLDAHFVTRVFHEIIDDSIRSQQLHLMAGGEKPALTRMPASRMRWTNCERPRRR